MGSRYRWGWWAIVAFFTAMIVVAIVEAATGSNPRRNCEKRGGRIEDYDCPVPRRDCVSNGRSTICTDRPCPWRCVMP